METLTTYTVKAKHGPDVWVFKYHLNGVLKSFEILEGIMNERQTTWLFERGNFPYREKQIQCWQKTIGNFDIIIGLPELTFEAFWNAYDNKQKKTRSEKLWEKLNDADRLKALDGIRRYNNYLRLHNGIAKANPDTYLYQRRWEDEF